MTRLTLLTTTALLLLGAVLPPALAQSPDSLSEEQPANDAGATMLETLTIRSKVTGIAATPLAIESSREVLDAAQADSFEDLGRTLQPGLGFNRTTGSVNIRGLEGPRVQTTIDGVPIPFLDDGARDADGGIDSFEFDTLSAVDVVRGADSSRAGDGALGGAVVLRTLQPEDVIGEGKTWGGLFRFAFDGADTGLTSSLALAKRFDQTSVLVEAGLRTANERRTGGDLDFYGAGRTAANPADLDQHNLLVKVKHETDAGHSFTLTGERFKRDRNIDLRSEQSATGNFRPGFWSGRDDNSRDRVSLGYQYEATEDDVLFDAAHAVVYWQHLTRDSGKSGRRFTSVVGDYARLSETENTSVGAAGYLERRLEGESFNHTLRLGGDGSFGTTSQYSSGLDSCDKVPDPACIFLHTNQADAPDVESTKLGFYLEDEIAFGGSGVSLTPGLRYDWYDQSPQDTPAYRKNINYDGLPPGQSGGAVSPKLLAKAEVAPDLALFAQWAMGFRSPTATELYLDYGGPGTYLVRGNPDLVPETSRGFEVGATYGDEDLGGRITGFYNRYRNFIDRQISGFQDPAYPLGVTDTVNRDRVRIYGLEASLTKRFDTGFHLGGSLTYADGVDLETDLKLGSVAPLKGIFNAGFATETWGIDAYLIGARGVSEDTNATFKAPGYGIVDMTAWWKPEKIEGLSLRAGLYNVFDKTYFDAVNVRDVVVSGTSPGRDFSSEPGRSVKISLTQRF